MLLTARRTAAAGGGAIAGWLCPGAALAQSPLWLFESAGSPGRDLADILWGLLVLAIAVLAIITALVAIALARVRFGVDLRHDKHTVRRPHDRVALRWIYLGLAATTAALIGFVFWTVETLAAVQAPHGEPAVTVDVTGHQFWWELRYAGEDIGDSFVTANEIHVPVGEPVLFRLRSEDVIHTFWVPALGGKTDLIPGQLNEAWLQAEEPGTYLGQCTEYCGLQHAHMKFLVVAEPPEDFERWLAAQRQPARPPDSDLAREGQGVFREHCGKCHTIRGVTVSEEVGPDLTHLMLRRTIAAGMLPNTPGNIAGWISNPQALKPGTTMPTITLEPNDLLALKSYLGTLE